MSDISRIVEILENVRDQSASGFAIALHIRLTSPDFLMQTYPVEWTDIYSEKGYVMVDPTVRWGFSETGSIRWSKLSETDEENILEQSRAYGMAFGVTIATDTGGSRSLASFSRPDREYDDAEIQVLSALIDDLHALTASPSGMGDDMRNALNNIAFDKVEVSATIS